MLVMPIPSAGRVLRELGRARTPELRRLDLIDSIS